MISPWDEFYYMVPRRQPQPQRHHHRNFPVTIGSLQQGPTYGGLLANVLNEGFRELQQMERELGHVSNTGDGAGQVETAGGGGFKFTCSVAGYAPDELNVDLDGDELVITGEHKTEGDGQSIHRTFTRRVLLPDTANKETVSCNIDDRGQLEVKAAPKAASEKPAKVNIPIGFKESATGSNGDSAVEGAKEQSK